MTAYVPSPASRPHGLSRRSLLRAGALGGLAVTVGSTGLLSACGSGDIVSALVPTRFISFGDGLSDLGQGSTGLRYTINGVPMTITAHESGVLTHHKAPGDTIVPDDELFTVRGERRTEPRP